MAARKTGKQSPRIDTIASLRYLCAFIVMATGCSVESGTTTSATQVSHNIASASQDPIQPTSTGKVRVLLFVRADCPISNRYAPRMESLWQQYRDRGVEFSLVYPDPQMTEDAMENHRHEYKLTIPPVHDPQHQWVQQARVTITPEVGLFDAHGNLVYHGRIDNQYDDLGRYRAEPTEQTLRDAIESLLSGKPIATGFRPAVGCLISDLRRITSDER